MLPGQICSSFLRCVCVSSSLCGSHVGVASVKPEEEPVAAAGPKSAGLLNKFGNLTPKARKGAAGIRPIRAAPPPLT
jgi:hypothetical protein